MSRKLKPKPQVEYVKWSWAELQTLLDNTFAHQHVKNKSRKFKFEDFDIPQEEMISELELAGYTVTLSADGKSINVI